jgi:hypothetical protein
MWQIHCSDGKLPGRRGNRISSRSKAIADFAVSIVTDGGESKEGRKEGKTEGRKVGTR